MPDHRRTGGRRVNLGWITLVYPDEPASPDQTALSPPRSTQDEDEILAGSDTPTEAAERIATYRGCSFCEALALVRIWTQRDP